MKSLKIIITALFILIPSAAFSQNWMMAQDYATAAIDSVLESNDDAASDFAFCEYSYFTFDPVSKIYSLYFYDDLSLDSAENVVVDVHLNGGLTVFTNDIFDSYTVNIPDCSDYVYLWNGTDSEITFSLSCDDADFTTFKLDKNTFNKYSCSAEYVYIKMRTLVGDVEKGQIHYKLSKGQGYKVEYDKASEKFEVFSDNRLK